MSTTGVAATLPSLSKQAMSTMLTEPFDKLRVTLAVRAASRREGSRREVRAV
ncbi:MAG: hypothetical protein ACYTX0_01470 [Nostoc sp.]